MIFHGDCLNWLVFQSDDWIDAVVCDPPYGWSFMGKAWDYDVPSVEVWREVLRVMKPGAHALVACGTRTQHRMAVNIEDAGFEIRDVVLWLHGQGFPKSLNVSKATDAAAQWAGWGTALKPACEFWTLCRKPLAVKTVAANVLQFGTGALNIDGARIETDELKSKVYRNKGDNFIFGGTYGKGTVLGNPTGRWPSNVILDEEAGRALDAQTGERGKSAGGNSTNIGGFVTANADESKRGKSCGFGDTGGASRFFYCAKTSPAERNGSRHPTQKPLALMRYLCKLITPPGGLILDPFAGSGTTGEAAILEGFDFIGCEKEAEYFEFARKRLLAVGF